MPLGRDERAELDAFKGDVVHEVKVTNDATRVYVERLVAPLLPLAQDVNELKKDTAKQTPIIERLDKRSRRADAERKRRSIIDDEARKDALKWKKRWRSAVAILGVFVALAELYHALRTTH